MAADLRADECRADDHLHYYAVSWLFSGATAIPGLLQESFGSSSLARIMVSLFIFACVAVEVIAKDEYLARAEATAEIVEKQFFGLNRAMVTLMQFVTLDNLSDVYYPLIMTRPWLCLYFFPILVFISIGLMNLVTAALVENAMQTAAHEAEEERLKLKKRVRGARASVANTDQR